MSTLRSRRLRLLGHFVVAVLCVSLGGCACLTGGAAPQSPTGKLWREFDVPVQRASAFRNCMSKPGGTCSDRALASDRGFFEVDRSVTAGAPLDTRTERPAGVDRLNRSEAGESIATVAVADLAREVLNHRVQRQLNGLFDVARGLEVERTAAADLLDTAKAEDGTQVVSVTFNLEEFEDYQRDVEAATLAGAWDALEQEANRFDVSPRASRRSKYISSYFNAYFRQGHFFQVTLDAAAVNQKIIQKIKENLPGLPTDEDYQKLASSMFGFIGADVTGTDPKIVFGSIQDKGFVTRGGQAVRFPAIELSATLGDSDVTSTEVDYVVVGGDLIRVLLHAIFDAEMQLPAVSNATGVSLESEGLLVNDGTLVDEEEFGRVEALANQVEAVVAAGTGRLLRGVSFFSLNNEALASSIETAVGVALRKKTEQAAWCWYACRFNERHRDLGDFAAVGYGDPVRIRIGVEGTR